MFIYFNFLTVIQIKIDIRKFKHSMDSRLPNNKAVFIPEQQQGVEKEELQQSYHEPYSRDIHHGEKLFPNVHGHEKEVYENIEENASPNDVSAEVVFL